MLNGTVADLQKQKKFPLEKPTKRGARGGGEAVSSEGVRGGRVDWEQMERAVLLKGDMVPA